MKRVMMAVALVVAGMFVPAAWAAEREVVLSPSPSAAPQARGDVLIRDTKTGKQALVFVVAQVKPRAAYSVRLVNPQGKPSVMELNDPAPGFKTDKEGYGVFSALVDPGMLDKWQSFEIVYHPDNDPASTKDAVVVLSGPVKK